jgi:hypothetical protein
MSIYEFSGQRRVKWSHYVALISKSLETPDVESKELTLICRKDVMNAQ